MARTIQKTQIQMEMLQPCLAGSRADVHCLKFDFFAFFLSHVLYPRCTEAGYIAGSGWITGAELKDKVENLV